jgi:tetratricopeptide (TPR) repeat protein
LAVSEVASHQVTPSSLKAAVLIVTVVLTLGIMILLQQQLDRRLDRTLIQTEQLGSLPPGKYLKPTLMGYHHLGADLLWLRLIQVIGQRSNTPKEYEWLYHALDVVTDLDPQYDYAYQVGGIILTNLANRVDLSNKLLEKGIESNPTVWQIPFYLGFNYYFYLQDPVRAADYMSRASRLPGRPPYLPLLATQMYAEAGNPETALHFLEAILSQSPDGWIKEQLETRIKEVMIERDIRMLEKAVSRYREREGHAPNTLRDLLLVGDITALPLEPFGGEYRLDSTTATISSTTHPERLHVYRPDEIAKKARKTP